jgi:hypothetical protein
MADTDGGLVTEVEKELRERFEKGETTRARVPSTARQARETRVDQLVLPDEERGKMPFTKDDFLVKENPELVAWERELRKFLLQLSPQHEHRVAAVHVFEWATGLKVADLMAEEKERAITGTRGRSSWRSDLRKLNDLLRQYFGKPYMTWIMGRKVPRAYRIPKGWYVYRHRPKTLTLYAEYADGVKL